MLYVKNNYSTFNFVSLNIIIVFSLNYTQMAHSNHLQQPLKGGLIQMVSSWTMSGV